MLKSYDRDMIDMGEMEQANCRSGKAQDCWFSRVEEPCPDVSTGKAVRLKDTIWGGGEGGYRFLVSHIPYVQQTTFPNAGHMCHQEQQELRVES